MSSRFVDLSLEELDPGDVVIRTKYSTINYKDALSYNGAGKIMRKFPTVAGIDMAGTVEIEQRSALETRRQGDRHRLRPRRLARRRLLRIRARSGRLDRAPPGEHDRVRRDDARHRRVHGGARDSPDAAQRSRARQRTGRRDRRDRRRRHRWRSRSWRSRATTSSRSPARRAKRITCAGIGATRGHAPLVARTREDPAARKGDVGRRGRQPRRRHPGVAARDVEDRRHRRGGRARRPT